MIIKRNLKSQMPSLKRCRLGGDSSAAGDDDDNSSSDWKKRRANGYYPLNLLGEVAAGVIPVSPSKLHSRKGFAASWCKEVSCSPPSEAEEEEEEEEELESKSHVTRHLRGQSIRATAEVPRPPLVRTSRGRVQVLPSRFNDSVIENWRKEGKTSLRDYSLDDDYEIQCDSSNGRKDRKREKFSFRTPKNCNGIAKKRRNGERIGYKCPRDVKSFCEEDYDEDVSVDVKKYLSSHSVLTSLQEQFVEDERCAIADLSSLERWERKDGLYGPEDFYSGDIIWAKSGRKDPFWPAIVIDPMTQAPELVLRSCVPDAACVMFFGYSGNENTRV